MLAPGKITSVSVAAFVDLTPKAPPAAEGAAAKAPPTPLKVADVETIIRSALGLTEADTIKVVETPFTKTAVAEAATEEESGSGKLAFYLGIAREASLGILVLGALVALKIFSGRRKRAAPVTAGGALVAAAGGALALPTGTMESDPAALRSRITAALQENPEEVKRLFLAWVEGEKGEA
jgi:flagellar biosynthesis/type III secretory pathway M-ring protein FliF/YscJ